MSSIERNEGSGVGAAFTSVLSSLQNQRRRLEVISNNIANINTIGFKASRMTFLETLGQTLGMVYTPFQQGKFSATNSPTDLAVDGRAFFAVRNGSEQQFTRAGAFYFDENGQFISQNRAVVQGWLMDEIVDAETSSVRDATPDLGTVEDIVLDPKMTVNAIATRNIWVSGNLNAGLSAIQNVIATTDAFRVNNSGEVLNATVSDELNDLVQTTTPFVDGDTLEISGTDHDGNAITATFTYGAGNDGTTMGDVLTVINTAYSGVATATLEEGKIILTDSIGGDSQSTINITAGAANTGALTLPAFANSILGYTPKATTSIVIYDSFGTAHQLTVEFTKTANNREWAWEISTDGSESITAGSTGTISFDTNGQFVSNTFDDGSGFLELDPGNGSTPLSVIVNFGGAEGLSALTQYDDVTSVSAKKQDGQASGKLDGIRVDKQGYIIGSFSNGVIKRLALLAMATFDDPTSLEKVGASNFMPTNFSGKASIASAFSHDSEILSGNLEVSNVDLADEFIQMIDAQKGYQAASRIVSTLDSILEETTRFGR